VRSRYRYDIEDLSINERVGFVGDHPLETIGALLTAVEHAIEMGLDSFSFLPRAKGGRKPLMMRLYFLANLARFWHELGKSVSGGLDRCL
jgi:hypothetical protein